MHNNHSGYSRWSWIIAFALALVLLWMYLTGQGPKSSCCAEEPLAPVAEVMPSEDSTIITEAFSFTATEYDFTSSGDASQITWAGADIGGLKALLSGNIKAEGDDRLVVLTGEVESEEAKEQTGMNAQAFFGPDVTLDNQITVVMVEETVAIIPPPSAKLYFGSGVHRLPADSQTTLEPVITWLNNNPEAKAVISGFHDETGSLSRNIALAKKRAKAAYNALVSAGIEAGRVEMRKPAVTTGDGDLSEARRVEISVE